MKINISSKGKKWTGIACAALSGVIIGSMATGVFAISKNGTNTVKAANEETQTVQTAVNTLNKALYKDETVYVIANADGSAKKIIVSDWIKNGNSDSKITDKSNLKDIKNTKGSQTYSMNKDNMQEWNADGKDIYYQGTSEKSLPVDLSVSYKLDGKAISAEELAGKSGKVEITFNYKNNEKQTVTVDGKEEQMNVPFIMLTGMIVDNDVFSNVSVTNGKIVNDGDRTVVMGFALPGMQDNLQVSKDKFEVPESVTFTADAKNFSLTTTMTLATNSIFNEIDTSKMDSAEGLKNSLTQLDTAAKQLMSGSSELYGGLSTLLTKSNALIAGIKEVSSGAASINKNLTALDSGLKELVSKNGDLQGGAEQVFETLLSTVQSQLKEGGITVPTLTIKNYNTVLKSVIASINEGTSIRQAVEAKRPQILAAVLSAANYTMEQYNGSPSLKAVIDNKVDTQMNLLVEQQKKLAIQSVNGAIKQLDSYNTFYQGIIVYTDGVAKASNGSTLLSEGAAQLSSGAQKLENGSTALVDGVSQLKDGSLKLSNGMKEFYDKGIKKLTDALNGDLGNIANRLKATLEASKKYNNYSGINSDMNGDVKFIYRTEGIEKSDK